MTRLLIGFLLALGWAAHSRAQEAASSDPSFLEPFRKAATEKWEKAIEKLEQLDRSEAEPTDGILFIGSSSIRRWDNIAADMAPYPVIRRGYGGAKFSDVAVFARRLIHPHQYRALVMFVGNDVSGSPHDHTADQVEQLVRYIVGVSHRHQPAAAVFLVEVTPTQKRWQVWDKIRGINGRLREIALSTPHTYFVPTASHYLLPDGQPRLELFVEDQLHLNDRGYDLWAELIRRRLNDVFQTMAELRGTDETGKAAGAE
ncbi:MAG: GDSL-type esterase/lipase family protein [Pirellulales bacterium]|nr:GDSL-type esterase/lipase family protein [Pirellulales bacterium]